MSKAVKAKQVIKPQTGVVSQKHPPAATLPTSRLVELPQLLEEDLFSLSPETTSQLEFLSLNKEDQKKVTVRIFNAVVIFKMTLRNFQIASKNANRQAYLADLKKQSSRLKRTLQKIDARLVEQLIDNGFVTRTTSINSITGVAESSSSMEIPPHHELVIFLSSLEAATKKVIKSPELKKKRGRSAGKPKLEPLIKELDKAITSGFQKTSPRSARKIDKDIRFGIIKSILEDAGHKISQRNLRHLL
jgi:hypothetical protein